MIPPCFSAEGGHGSMLVSPASPYNDDPAIPDYCSSRAVVAQALQIMQWCLNMGKP